MKTSSSILPGTVVLSSQAVSALAVLWMTLACVPGVLAQSDNFNSGTDTGWTRFDPLGLVGLAASYTFPPDGTGGSAYRIQAQANPTDLGGIGPGRAGSFRTDVSYTGRFSVGVDVIAYDNNIDQAFGMFWFAQNLAPGGVTGYTMTYEPIGREILISSINNEQPTTVGKVGNIYLDPTQRYRFVASSYDGYTYLAQVFFASDTDNPIVSAIALDASHTTGSGGVFDFDGTSPSITGADATFDNYVAFAPAAGVMRATVCDLSPAPQAQAAAIYPNIVVGIIDRDTSVNTNALVFWMDGAVIPSSSLGYTGGVLKVENPVGWATLFSGATINYQTPALLPPGSRHTNQIAFADNTGTWKTNTWSWTSAYPFLRAANSLPLGSFNLRGWDVRMVQTNGAPLGNSLARAEQQLAIPPLIPFEVTTQTVLQVFNFNDAGDGTTATDFGYFTGASPVPGLPPNGTHNNIAIEMFAYLELTAGVHRFGAVSDDGFQLRSGASLRDPLATVMGVRDGGTFNGTFDFVVEATGVYPARCVWYQNGGGADFQLFSVDLNDPNARILVNDPTDPAGVVKAYLPIRLLSSSTVTGPYSTATGAVIDTTAKTITVPKAGPVQFYKMQTLNPVTITTISITGNNVVLTYQ